LANSERSKTFNYAVGMFGTSIPINLLKTYAAAYYVDKMGVATNQWGMVLILYTIIDMIDNPIYGYLSDRTRTKWGRRRPWLVIGTPLLVLGLIAFFATPGFLSGNSLLAWAALFYVFTGTVDSLINANYGALFPELFTDDVSRAKANAMRQAFQLVAMIISIALTPVVAGAIGFAMTALVYGIIGGVVILYMALKTREHPERLEEPKPVLWGSLKNLVSNPKFWIAGFTNAFYSGAMSLVMAGLPFYAKYTLGISALQTTIMFATVLLVAIGAVAIWAFFVKRFDLMKVWRAAMLTLALAYIPLFFATSFVPALLSAILVGFGFAGVITTMDLVQARIMDEDYAKNKVHREGIISNALGFMNRLSELFKGVAFLLLFSLFAFESGDNPGPQAALAAKSMLTIFPMILMIIALVFSVFLHFPKKNVTEQEPLSFEGEAL
jgi:GPH family glycoside/pentoside/hexuronide:cation symporter